MGLSSDRIRLLPFERVDLIVLVSRLTELKAMLLTSSIPIVGFIIFTVEPFIKV